MSPPAVCGSIIGVAWCRIPRLRIYTKVMGEQRRRAPARRRARWRHVDRGVFRPRRTGEGRRQRRPALARAQVDGDRSSKARRGGPGSGVHYRDHRADRHDHPWPRLAGWRIPAATNCSSGEVQLAGCNTRSSRSSLAMPRNGGATSTAAAWHATSCAWGLLEPRALPLCASIVRRCTLSGQSGRDRHRPPLTRHQPYAHRGRLTRSVLPLPRSSSCDRRNGVISSGASAFG